MQLFNKSGNSPKVYSRFFKNETCLKTFKVMKLTFILLLGICFQISSKGISQTVTFSGSDVHIEVVFREIKKQTGYVFFYATGDLATSRPVTVKFNNTPFLEALKVVMQNQPLEYVIKSNTVFVKASNNLTGNPQKTKFNSDELVPLILEEVKGKIINEKGEPVSATVTIKGTNKSVGTAADGSFRMQNVDERAILVITGVSIITYEVSVNGKSDLQSIIVKIKIKEEDPVVVTAFGIERNQKELGFSAVKISGDEINKANPGNLLTGLTAKVSGLSIATQSSDMQPQMRVLLRGIRSFGATSSNQPLFILNGSPMSFGSDDNSGRLVMDFINNINPADIEDVSIIKGANGAAIYGPEAVNGVIIINTKKGQKGGRPSITYRNNVSFSVVDFRNDKTLQREYGLGNGVDAFGNGVYSPTSEETWGPRYNGEEVEIGFPDEFGVRQKVTYQDTKDARRFWDLGKTIRHNLSFSQSDKGNSFYLGLGRADMAGVLPKDKLSQSTAILSVTKQFGRLQLITNLNYANTARDLGPEINLNYYPTFIPLLKYKDYSNERWATHDRFWFRISPYENIDLIRTKVGENALAANLALILKASHWLTIRIQPGVNYSATNAKAISKPIFYSDFAKRNDFNKFFDQPPGVREVLNSQAVINNDLLISTTHKPGNFFIRTNFGNSIRETFIKQLEGTAAPLSIPVYNLTYTRNLLPNSREQALLTRAYALFASINGGYKNSLFLEVTARRDWDSRLARAANGNNIYVGANTSLVLQEVIPGLKKIKWISSARLRASISNTANMNIEPYQSERILELIPGYPYTPDPLFPERDVLAFRFLGNNNPNPLLRPEKIIAQEYGANFSFLNDLFTLDVTYYKQLNAAAILDVRNSLLSGAPTIDNAGKFNNWGWEFDLKMSPKLSKTMFLTIEGRFAINDNKVTQLSDVYNGLFPLFNGRQTLYAPLGGNAYSFAFKDWKRDPSGRVIVDRTTGLPIVEDFGKFSLKGQTLPKYLGSFIIDFTYKAFGISFLAEHSSGNYHFFSKLSTLLAQGMHPVTTTNGRERYVFPNSVYDDGTGKYIPNTDVLVKNTGRELYQQLANISNYTLVKADFWKVKELSIRYELGVKTKIVKGILFNLYARDLFAFYAKSNIVGDPQLLRGPGQRNFQGLEASFGADTRRNSGTNGSEGVSNNSNLPGMVTFGLATSFKF
jgi:TonB-linked SusC/RagA family outer membrane protein